MQNLSRPFLYSTVFLTGAAVLIIEVAAVRILSPYYGTSLVVVSSVLTVILTALSVGYWWGGTFADQHPYPRPLYTIITIAGICVLFLELLILTLLPGMSAYFSVLSGPLVFSLVLFFLPAFFLAVVSPYVAKLLSQHETGHTGHIVGVTLFFGTAGSIVGSLATGFLLVPFAGIAATMVGTGVAVVVLGIVGTLFFALHEQDDRQSIPTIFKLNRFFLLTTTLAAILAVVAIQNARVAHAGRVVFETEGKYSHIAVHKLGSAERPLFALERDRNFSSLVDPNTYDLQFGYAQFAEFYRVLKPDTENFLLLGGGAYTISRTLAARDENLSVDVVEIEPMLFALAQKYFDLEDTERITNHVGDARVFLQSTEEKYDVIYGDVFSTNHAVPPHLATVEFYETVRERLTENGIYMQNIISTRGGDTPTLTGSLLKTIREVFPNTQFYAFTEEDPRVPHSSVVIARKGSAPITLSDAREVTSREGETFTLGDMRVPLDTFDFTEELRLTDDHAPIEFLATKQKILPTR